MKKPWRKEEKRLTSEKDWQKYVGKGQREEKDVNLSQLAEELLLKIKK